MTILTPDLQSIRFLNENVLQHNRFFSCQANTREIKNCVYSKWEMRDSHLCFLEIKRIENSAN